MAESAVREFMVPDLGEGLEEATIVAWFVEVGDSIGLNDPLCTVETAKAEVEIPSPFAGVLVERRGIPGETLAVGSTLARIETAAVDRTETPTPEPSKREAVLVGYGVDNDQDRSRRVRHAGGTPMGPAPGPRPVSRAPSPLSRPLAKPPVRKLALSLGLDLAALAPGSGPGGVVTRADVMAAGTPTMPSATDAQGADEVIPVQGVRARMAERMTVSRATIPDATCSVETDCTKVIELRAALRDEAPVVTPFAILCRLLVQALGNHRLFNATYVEDGPKIRVHSAIHLGIGTATDRGLVVTVVRDADRLTTIEMAQRINDLTVAARQGSVTPSDLQGSTFTVSNFGALGLDDGIPVINHPETAILGIGSVKPRPFVVDGAVVARSTARVTLAFDHRVCDGAQAGAFMSELRRLYEAPELGLLHA